MQNKDQQKKKRILKTILTDISRKEKAITRYTRIFKNKNSRNVVWVEGKIVLIIILMIVTKLIIITIK